MTIQFDFPEVGYTPANLRYLLQQTGWRREDVAEVLGVQLDNVHRWAIETDRKRHVDMPLTAWRELLTAAAKR